MANGSGSLLRNTGASLMALSGSGQIAALWLRDLTGNALVDALLGTVYLIISIGLFGQSRFSLFMAIIVPATAVAALVFTIPDPGRVYTLRIAVDIAVILVSTAVLWQVRHHPSV